MSDRLFLYVSALVRATATGMVGVLLGIYLAELQLDADAIGTVVTCGLAGAASAALFMTLLADRFGRRRCLTALAVLSSLGAIALACSQHPLVLGLSAFIGMVNGMGRDRGGALIIEQAALPATVSAGERTLAFAQYNVLQDVGHALGALLAAVPRVFAHVGADSSEALRWSIATYAVLSLLPCLIYWRLSAQIESPPSSVAVPLTAASRRILWRISALFALDSLGGGFLTTALLSYFFHERFDVGVDTIAGLFFIARIANAASHFGAAWLAKRIGLVNTMVFTHIPSSVLLMTVAIAPSFTVAALLFLLREGLVEMDVPTRQSYVMAVVAPHERTAASGVTHLVRLCAWAVAPALAGVMMANASMLLPLLVGAGLKILYDVLLWRAFRTVRPPEE